MSAGTQIRVEDYLSTNYDPDCDYIDGHLEERNLGEWDHASLQMRIAAYLYARQDQWGIRVVPELRVRVSPTRFRIPDVCVVLGEPDEQVLTKPPFLCIEILSPEDRMSRIQERIDDYLRMGVRYVWILDPALRRAYAATSPLGLREIKDALTTENPEIEVPLTEIFA
ncbi:MAG TPA: Uma2 family endonuclease [Bryobacteraceae bacterium]|nr:Uma2 family endonuclease [Bryobacteraceae bacterium]